MCANSADDHPAAARPAATSAAGRAAVAEALRRSSRILVTTHVRPDGDGLGSMLALRLAGASAGKDVAMLLPDAVPRRYAFLFQTEAPRREDSFAALADRAEAIVVVDTCAAGQLGPIADGLRARREKLAVIDHHATAEDIAEAVWRDESAAAAGVMLAELLETLGWPVPPPAAEALMTAICTDTGWLRYANTDARALAAVGRLIDAGIRPDVLYGKIYHRDRPQRLKLLAAALNSLQLHADDRVAVMTLSGEDLARTGASADETEDFVNEPLRIATVEVSAMLVVISAGQTRVSLRSRGQVDVSAVAGRFGGGGHARAAGYREQAGVQEVAERLLAVLEFPN